MGRTQGNAYSMVLTFQGAGESLREFIKSTDTQVPSSVTEST